MAWPQRLAFQFLKGQTINMNICSKIECLHNHLQLSLSMYASETCFYHVMRSGYSKDYIVSEGLPHNKTFVSYKHRMTSVKPSSSN